MLQVNREGTHLAIGIVQMKVPMSLCVPVRFLQAFFPQLSCDGTDLPVTGELLERTSLDPVVNSERSHVDLKAEAG